MNPEKRMLLCKLRDQYEADPDKFGEQACESMFSREYLGWCVECEEWTADNIEPDVDFSCCPACKQMSVFAAEQILIWCVS